MKVFVAGGTGVIGRRAVPALVEAGHDVTVIARSEERDRLVRDLGATPVRVDLFDRDGVHAAVAGHEAVVNLATHIPPMSKAAQASNWAENDRIRSEGSTNLVAAAKAHGARRFVQESITFPYADGGSEWVGEDVPRPTSDISVSVEAAEGAALGFSGDSVVLRFAQFHAPDASHIATFSKALRFRASPLIGAPDTYVSFIGMPAAARAVVAALDAPPGVYNIADDDPPTRREAGEAIAAALGTRPPWGLPVGLVKRFNPSAEILARSHRISNERFKQATGWTPDDVGAQGVARSITEYRAG